MQEAHKVSSQTAAFFTRSQKSSSFAADVFLPFFASQLSAYTVELQSHCFSVNGELEERGKTRKKARNLKEIAEGKSNFLQFPTSTNSGVSLFWSGFLFFFFWP